MSERPARPAPRIVDAVFAPSLRGSGTRRRRAFLAVGGGLALHLAVVGYALLRRPVPVETPPRSSGAHLEPPSETEVELPPPPPTTTPPPVAEKPPPPERAAPPRPVAHRAARAPRTPPATPPPAPAQAGKVVAADDAATTSAPAIVQGQGDRYAGGSTTATGQSTQPVTGPVDPHSTRPGPSVARAGPPGPDRSASVSLEGTDWSCPWPEEAEEQSIDEQSVVLRVTVRADGTAESVRVERDPGAGFGAAARACAQRTRFTPARDREGRPIRAESPPIRVHFTR